MFSLRRPFTLPLVLRTGNKAQFELEEEEEEDTRPMEVTYHKTHTKKQSLVSAPSYLYSFFVVTSKRFLFSLTKNQNPNHAPRDQFCQDPALLRERAEARRAAFHQKKG